MRDKPSPELMRALETLGKRPVQPPATPQEPEQPVKGYTLQGLSNYFGWGLRDDRAIWRFIHERESLLRLCQSLLGTEKSKAQTAEFAIRERIEQLSTPSPEGQTWQPIETAPKDGTRLDLWAKSWLPAFDRFEFRRFADCYWSKGDTMCNVKAAWTGLDREWHPTHWRHLPSPPTPEGTAK